MSGPWAQLMRDRAIVHVAGPASCGKTTFIESVLGSVDKLLIVARCVRDDTFRHVRETAPRTHPELQRYREAGASGAALFVFPQGDTSSDAFFMTELMQDYSQGVVLEGNNPLVYVDLAVFVAPPPAAGEKLFVRRKRDMAREKALGVDAIERLLRELDGVAAARKAPKPKAVEHWAIGDRYSGIEHAQLVVVNICEDSERVAGEQLAAELVRLRKEEELFKDVLGFRGSRVPITIVVADLAQPADPGRKKALARVRRAFCSGT